MVEAGDASLSSAFDQLLERSGTCAAFRFLWESFNGFCFPDSPRTYQWLKLRDGKVLVTDNGYVGSQVGTPRIYYCSKHDIYDVLTVRASEEF